MSTGNICEFCDKWATKWTGDTPKDPYGSHVCDEHYQDALKAIEEVNTEPPEFTEEELVAAEKYNMAPSEYRKFKEMEKDKLKDLSKRHGARKAKRMMFPKEKKRKLW